MKDLVCPKTRQLTISPLCSSPLGRKWCSSVERAVDHEALDQDLFLALLLH